MSWHFELVAGPFSFTEGPAWDGEAVLFSDIPNNRIMRYQPDTGECTVFRIGSPLIQVVIDNFPVSRTILLKW